MRLTDKEIESAAFDMEGEDPSPEEFFIEGAKWARACYEHDLKMMKWDYEFLVNGMLAVGGWYIGEKVFKDFEHQFKVLKERWK